MFAKWMLRSAALIGAALITVAFRPAPATPFPDLDKRPRVAGPVAAGQQQAANSLRALAPEATVQF